MVGIHDSPYIHIRGPDHFIFLILESVLPVNFTQEAHGGMCQIAGAGH